MSLENREFKKTFVMRQVEASFCQGGQSIKDLLEKEYCKNKKSATVLAAALSIYPATVLNWIRKLDIPEHSQSELWSFPETRQKRIKGIKRSWQDEEKKAERVVKIHSERWREKRQQCWDRLSLEEKSARIRKTVEGNRETCREKRAACLKEHLGENPEQVLQNLIGEGLSALEIAVRTGVDRHLINSYLQEICLQTHKNTTLDHETIERRRSLFQLAKEANLIQYLPPNDCLVVEVRFGNSGQVVPLEEIGKQLGLSRERIRQIEVRALSALEKMLLGELIPRNGVVSFPRGRKSTHLAVESF
ncbi:MAG: sigma factor-like helix-turn-helix DNA-binding protein [Candidatus Daviesbacteria bacterium]|nr:sigma factor-like helix-turn-helix DNA-binding protein [Candidatus Daviesbacteria bacterium]